MEKKSSDFDWLINTPASDVNFTGTLAKSGWGTVKAALMHCAAQIGSKTKVKAFEARLRQLEKEGATVSKKEPRAHDAEAEAATQIYEVAQADMKNQLAVMREEIGAIREESQAMGALQAIETNIAFQEMLKAITLQRIKENKAYKKGGLTWVEFCESLGLAWRTVDQMLEDIRPVVNTFSAKIADFTGFPFSKIRLLGKQISANLADFKDGCLVYGDETIPLTPENADDIQALIDRINDDAKEQVEEAAAKLSAKDKVLKNNQDLLNKQERILRKYKKHAVDLGLTEDEDAFLQNIDNLKMGFDGYLMRLGTLVKEDDTDFETLSPRMKAAYISTAHYMKMQILAVYDTAVTTLGNPAMNPELLEDFERWEADQQQQG